jgi:hypothetical protein
MSLAAEMEIGVPEKVLIFQKQRRLLALLQLESIQKDKLLVQLRSPVFRL